MLPKRPTALNASQMELFEKEYNLNFDAEKDDQVKESVFASKSFLVVIIALCIAFVCVIMGLFIKLNAIEKENALNDLEVANEEAYRNNLPVKRLDSKDITKQEVKEEALTNLAEVVSDITDKEATIITVEDAEGNTRVIFVYDNKIVSEFPEGLDLDNVQEKYMLEDSEEYRLFMWAQEAAANLDASGINFEEYWMPGSPITPKYSQDDPTWWFDGWWTLPDLGKNECMSQEELLNTGWEGSQEFNLLNERAYWLCDKDMNDLNMDRQNEKNIRIITQNDAMVALGLVN